MKNKEASNTADWTEAEVSAILDNMRANNEARKMPKGTLSALADKQPLPVPDSVKVKALKAKAFTN